MFLHISVSHLVNTAITTLQLGLVFQQLATPDFQDFFAAIY